MVQTWGSIEELEEQREDILDFLSELEIEATPLFFSSAVDTLLLLLGNIIEHPTEDKYKQIKAENKTYHSNLGRHKTTAKLIKFIGFQSTRLDDNKLAYIYKHPTGENIPTHPLILITYDELRTS